MIIPPLAGVRLVEYRDRIELTPVYWLREFVGLGRFRADTVGPQSGDDLHPLFNALMGDKEIWVIASWRRYEDGHEEVIRSQYLDPEASEDSAREKFEREVEFLNMGREELEQLGRLIVSPEDRDYVESRFPDARIGPPEPPKTGQDYKQYLLEQNLYQARLKVLAGIQPKTIALIQKADEANDPVERKLFERKAVEAYFAEVATYWTDDMIKAWERNNPVGAEWLCEFARVMEEPERQLDPIKHELALNWLRRAYNLMTENELSDAILIATGQRLIPNTLKKKREKLRLTARPRGPRQTPPQ